MKQYKIKERKSTATHLKEVIEPLHKVKRTMKAEEYINYIPIMFSQLFKQAYRCAKLENNEGDVELIEGLAQKHGIPITQGTGFADYPSEYSWYL